MNSSREFININTNGDFAKLRLFNKPLSTQDSFNRKLQNKQRNNTSVRTKKVKWQKIVACFWNLHYMQWVGGQKNKEEVSWVQFGRCPPPSAAHLSDARDVPFGHFFLSLALQFGQSRHIWSRGSSEMELLRHCLDAAIMVDGHADFGWIAGDAILRMVI